MTLLFLGVLLLIIGFFYFGYYTEEGFQTASGTASGTPSGPINTCITGTDEQKCNPNCRTGLLPDPTSDEELSYRGYESINLVDASLSGPPVVVPTTVRQYNIAGSLTATDLDPKQAVPWDFDNSSLNPAITLWGTVHSKTSELIYQKCYEQAVFGDIQNLDYDPDSGRFSYKSLVFGTTIYDQEQAAGIQFTEMFVNLQAGEILSAMYERVNLMPNEAARLSKLTDLKEAQFKLENQITDYKNAINPPPPADPSMQRPTALSPAEATRLVANKTADGDYDRAWHNYSQTTSQFPMSASEKLPGSDSLKDRFFKWGRPSIKKSPLDIDFSNEELALAKLKQLADDDVDNRIRNQRKVMQGKGITPSSAFKYSRNLKTEIAEQNNEARKKTQRSFIFQSKTINDLIVYFGKGTMKAAALRANTELAIAVSKKAVNKAAIGIAVNIAIGLLGFIPGFAAITVPIQALMIAFDLACQTLIGPIFSSFLDADAVCPKNRDGSTMWNLNDYFYGTTDGSKFLGTDMAGGKAPQVVGDVLITLLTNLPGFGSFFAAFGPYICVPNTDTWRNTDGAIVKLRLKNNLKCPPYYYDPTLSIYNAYSRPKFQAGVSTVDERLYNPLTFHYNKNIDIPVESRTVGLDGKDVYGAPGYPVWVDFANVNMLNKMAQFYYDASRKCPITTSDGMLSFEYISKFMGLVSLTELTCDVQCEIKQITFDPESGVKICETIVPIAPGTLNMMYHDRRFYFFKDMSKGTRIADRTIRILETDTAKLQKLMEDNMDIYTVTGCTNTDGTAPDCATYNSEGNSVSSPVISLGEPSGTYRPPMVDIGNNGNTIPFDSNCGRQSHFTRYNDISHPSAGTNASKNNRLAPVVTNPILIDNWIYAYKDRNNRYFYPSANVATYNNLVAAPDSLKTAKYWSILWSKCDYNDATCQINTREGASSIVSGTIEGLIGAGFGIDQVQQGYQLRGVQTSNRFNGINQLSQFAGGLMQTTMNVQFPGQEATISRQLQCNIDSRFNANSDTPQYGTYIMNGRIETVQQGFLVDQGPFINWAPGYTPTIKYCMHQRLELYDCVNPYAVRRFVNIYHNAKPGKQIKKIYNITPTLQNNSTAAKYSTMDTNTKNATWDVDSSTAMCIYNMDVVDFDRTKFDEVPNTKTNINVGLYLQQMKADKTCAFVPRCKPIPGVNARNEILPPNTNMTFLTMDDESDIFKPIYFSINTKQPEWPVAGDEKIVTSPPDLIKCSLATVQNKLIATFNDAHDGVPKFLSVGSSASDSINLKTFSGQNMCMFKGAFGSVYNPETGKTLNPSNTPTTSVRRSATYNSATRTFLEEAKEDEAYMRNITILIDPSGNYISDDFPIHYTYTPVPKRSTWFDVPPRATVQAASGSFARIGCATDLSYNDCSNTVLVDALVTQYNESNTNAKILKVWRSFTPTAVQNYPICDYDVERLKTIVNGPAILDRETIRFYLKPNSTTCGYDLNIESTNNNPVQLNSGFSLNLSESVGMFKTPYNTAVKYSTSIQKQFFSAISNYIGYNIPGITNQTTTDTLQILNTLRTSLYSNTHLKSCPEKTCMDYTIITAMLNRYNFDAYPSYPPKQNTVTKNTIVRVTKVGTATPTVCQMELYLRTEFFTDFLYTPLPDDTRFYIQDYVFKLLATPVKCKFKVQPFTQYDISESTMDISGESFTLKCPAAVAGAAPPVCPSLIPIGVQSIAGTLSSLPTSNYIEPMVRCDVSRNTDTVLQLIKDIYNRTPVFTKAGTPYYNRIHKVTRAFNGMPNVLEFKVTTKRVYWDSDYSVPYYTGESVDEGQDAYIIATWPEGVGYEVETGYYWKDSTDAFVATPVETPSSPITIAGGIATAILTASDNTTKTLKMCTPTLEELFYPDLNFTATAVYKTNPDGSKTQIYLPYLANDGLINILQTQTKKYSSA